MIPFMDGDEAHSHGHAHRLSGRFHAHEHPAWQRHWWPEPETPETPGHLQFLLRQSIEIEKAKREHKEEAR